MGLFEQFPYTNFHEMNLDWLLGIVKKLADEVAGFDGDIQEYVNERIDQMIEDGTLFYAFDKRVPVVLKPDWYDGTDAEKLQACLDELKTDGGAIIIDRAFDIDADLVNRLKTDQTNKKRIFIYGIGNAYINMNDKSFISDRGDASTGGLTFSKIRIEGTKTFMNGDCNIRCWFEDCTFVGFEFVLYGENTTQSMRFDNCYFEDCQHVYVSVGGGSWDIHFDNCIAENCGEFLNTDYDNLASGAYNITVKNCCIESITNSAIVPGSVIKNLKVEGCYFEAAQPVDLRKCGGTNTEGVQIVDNVMFLASGVAGVLTPQANGPGVRGRITGNVCVPNTRDIVSMAGAPTGSACGYEVSNNNANLPNPEYYNSDLFPSMWRFETLTVTIGNVTANTNHLLDNTKDYTKARALTIIRDGHAGDYFVSGSRLYVGGGNALYYRAGSAATSLTVTVGIIW